MSKPKITDVQLLVEEYQSGMSSEELAEKYGTARQVILRWLKRAGCPIRSMSENQKLRYSTKPHPWTGRKHSDEDKAKMCANHADVSGEKNPNFGGGCFGESNGNWKGGVDEACKEGRNTTPHLKWKQEVFERDNYECQLCKETKKLLHSHHIINWRLSEELRFDVDNGITLCVVCHGVISRKEEEYITLFSEMVRIKKIYGEVK